MDNLRRWFSEKLAFSLQDNGPGGKPSILTQMNLDGIVEYIQAGKCRNIITMAGAGISTCKPISHLFHLIFGSVTSKLIFIQF